MEGTFHSGVIRHAPGESIPWRQSFSPVNLIKAWWLSPVARASVISAWCITIATWAYCISLNRYASDVYNTSVQTHHTLQCALDRNKELEFKMQELEKELRGKLEKDINADNNKLNIIKRVFYHSYDKERKQRYQSIYGELIQEKKRAAEFANVTLLLRKELFDVRSQMNTLQRENEKLTKELHVCNQLVLRYIKEEIELEHFDKLSN